MPSVTLAAGFRQDIRFAVRQLRRSPGFAGAAVATLALGIAASVAIFAFVHAALIRPLPYPAPGALVGVFEKTPRFVRSNLSYLDYLDWKRMNTVFTSLSAYQGSRVTLTTPGGAQPVAAGRVSDDFFRTLDVSPAVGRDFRPGEDLPPAARVAILSDAAWHTRYGGRDVLGESVTLNSQPHTIVGVLPPAFHFAPVGPAEFWIPMQPAPNSCFARRSCHNIYGVARLRAGVSIEAASANMIAIAGQLETQYPDSNRDQGATIVPLADVIVGGVRPILLVLLGGAGLLLLIATVNVTSLLLVRSESRRREMAVRSALGASRARVVRQFATEALLLVVFGAAIGLAGAYWVIQLLVRLIPANVAASMPYLQGLGLHPAVMGFAGAIALAAVVVFALTPVVHLALAGGGAALAEGSRGSTGSTWRRAGSKLVVVELATAVVLLVGSLLLGKSLVRLLNVDIGLTAGRLATIGVSAPLATYSSDPQLVQLARTIVDRIAALPGVQSVGLTSTPPLQGGNTTWIRVEGRPYNGEHNDVNFRDITPGYFSTLQARLLRGRYFNEQDDATAPRVVIINQAFVRQYFPGEDPIGRRLLYAPTTTEPPMEIVGLVDDVKESAMDSSTPPTMYVAFAQDPTGGFTVVARTAQAEQAVLPTLASTIRAIDPGISTLTGRTMTEIINASQAAYLRRSAAWLVSGFAALAWLLGVVGLYGVVSYSVSQRTREIGVRMALGAERRGVTGLILGEAGRLVLAGVAAGLVLAVGAARLMDSLLFGVKAWDVTTLLAVASVVIASALAASYVPARRAASTNPVEALRAG